MVLQGVGRETSQCQEGCDILPVIYVHVYIFVCACRMFVCVCVCSDPNNYFVALSVIQFHYFSGVSTLCAMCGMCS